MNRIIRNSDSLKNRMFISFLVIILVLSAFHFILFSFTHREIQEVIMSSNRMMLVQEINLSHGKTDPNHQLHNDVVPYTTISAQLSKLRTAQTSILLLSVIITLGLSYWFSRRFQTVSKQTNTSIIQNPGKPKSVNTTIREYDTIAHHIDLLRQERDLMYDELRNTRTLLTHYGYIAKLKSLTTNNTGSKGDCPP